jgi:hypothetical protein
MLNAATVPAHIAFCYTKRRYDLLDALLFEVGQIFPQITYEVDAQSRTANAQALMRGAVRVVRLYGGLAMHPMVGADALVFTFLHETGHHLAEGHRLALDPKIACECAADKWALVTGRGQWERAFNRRFDISAAMDELSAMIDSVQRPLGQKRRQAKRCLPKACWAPSWTARKAQLLKLRSNEMPRFCCLSK